MEKLTNLTLWGKNCIRFKEFKWIPTICCRKNNYGKLRKLNKNSTITLDNHQNIPAHYVLCNAPYSSLIYCDVCRRLSWIPVQRRLQRLSPTINRSYAAGAQRLSPLSAVTSQATTSRMNLRSTPAAKSRLEIPEAKFAWSAQQLSPVSRPATNSGERRWSKDRIKIKREFI